MRCEICGSGFCSPGLHAPIDPPAIPVAYGDKDQNADALTVLLWRIERGYNLRLLTLPRVVESQYGQANDRRYREPTPA